MVGPIQPKLGVLHPVSNFCYFSTLTSYIPVGPVPPLVAGDVFRHDGFQVHQYRSFFEVMCQLIRQPVNQVIVLAVSVSVIDNRAESGSALPLARGHKLDGCQVATKYLQVSSFLPTTKKATVLVACLHVMKRCYICHIQLLKLQLNLYSVLSQSHEIISNTLFSQTEQAYS